MQMRISKKTLKTLPVILLIVILVAGIFFIYKEHFAPITSFDYNGEMIHFRENLREASEVEVLPNEDWITNTFWSSFLRNITIVFKNDSSDLGLVGIQAIEITNKLAKAYNQAGIVLMSESSYLESNMTAIPEGYIVISAKAIDSYKNLEGGFTTALIVLIPPSETDITTVKVSNNAVFIHGKDAKDFDLATIKFLMVVLGIEI